LQLAWRKSGDRGAQLRFLSEAADLHCAGCGLGATADAAAADLACVLPVMCFNALHCWVALQFQPARQLGPARVLRL
jgi:hypothetical protein